MKNHKNNFWLKILLLIFALSINIPFLAANNWYIDKDAKGLNNGKSWSNAWTNFNNINWQVNGINPGDTLFISGGIESKIYHNELYINGSGLAGAPITIKVGQIYGHNGTVIIDTQNGNSGITISDKEYIVISGQVNTKNDCKIKITNSASSGVGIDGMWTNIIVEYLEIDHNGNSDQDHGINIQATYKTNLNLEIRYCRIHDNYMDAISALQTTSGEATQFGTVRIHHNDLYNFVDDGIETSFPCDIYNNKIRSRMLGTKIGHPDGIQFYNSYTRIYNNDFYDIVRSDDESANSAIFSDAFDPELTINPNHIYIYNNRITETNYPYPGEYYRGIAIKLAEPGVTGGHDIIVANNTLVGIPFFAMMLTCEDLGSANVDNIQFVNNIIKDCSRSDWGSACLGFEKGNGTITYGSWGDNVDVIVDYNAIYNSSDTFSTDVNFNGISLSYSQFKSTSGCQDHDVMTDPSLDVNYRLLSSSPLIDKGISEATYFTIDKDGIQRPQGNGWDIGAYEFLISNNLLPPSNLRFVR